MALIVVLAVVLAGCDVSAWLWVDQTQPATPAPTAAAPLAGRPSAPPGRSVSIAPMGRIPAATLQSLRDFYRDQYRLEITILPAAPIDPRARDASRRQLVAEELIRSLRTTYPDVLADPGVVIIGIVGEDLYIRARTDWEWAFGIRDGGRLAVVSTARMGFPYGAASLDVQLQRLRKMVTRDIGVLYYGLPLNDDPDTVLFADINGIDDLDRIGEGFWPILPTALSGGGGQGPA